MANTLNQLLPDAYVALDVVSRELIGFIPGITRDATADQVALGQTVRVFKTRKNSAGRNIVPAMALPDAADQTVDNDGIQITKVRAFPFSWSGEQQYAMDKGPGYLNIRQDQIAQAFRAAVNEVEADLAIEACKHGSRAHGAVGTLPFATNLGDTAQVRKILDDNGSPESARSLVISTSIGAQLRTLQNLTKVNESGTSMTLRDGELLNVHGFSIRESGQIAAPAAGTAANAKTSNAGYAIGETEIVLKAAGTGTLVVGDIIKIDGDGNQYVVTEAVVAVSGATVKIAEPGLLKAIPAAEKDVTVVASGLRSVAFTQNALLLTARLPVLPPEGDLALDHQTITDPRSGLSFRISCYPGYNMNTYEVSLAWGVKAVKPEHMAVLLE